MENFDNIIANGGAVCYNSLASRYSHFRTGGKIELLLEPSGYQGLLDSCEYLAMKEFFVAGAMTNTLISDKGVSGIVLSTKRARDIVVDGDYIIALAGDNLMNVAAIAKKSGLSGMEELSGIPGSVGGGVYMNCGAYNRNISDIIVSAEVFYKGKLTIMTTSEMAFGYRDSVFQHNRMIILKCTFKLTRRNKASITTLTNELTQKRRSSQPELPSLGCVFKKVADKSAGYYIEKAGLKGKQIGGAMISPKHANFIVNTGGAISADYINLVEHIISEVYRYFEIVLEREVIYLGDSATG